MPLDPPAQLLEDTEVTWLNGDPTVTSYCLVTAFARKRADGAKGADLRITQSRELRIDNAHREVVHDFVIDITWPLVSGASSMVDDQRYLRGYIDALRNRIRGALGDHTHSSGGVFLSVSEDESGGAGSGITVDFNDPIAALDDATPALTATVRYSATEPAVAN